MALTGLSRHRQAVLRPIAPHPRRLPLLLDLVSTVGRALELILSCLLPLFLRALPLVQSFLVKNVLIKIVFHRGKLTKEELVEEGLLLPDFHLLMCQLAFAFSEVFSDRSWAGAIVGIQMLMCMALFDACLMLGLILSFCVIWRNLALDVVISLERSLQVRILDWEIFHNCLEKYYGKSEII